MVQIKDFKNYEGELNAQIKENRKSGGPSDILKMEMAKRGIKVKDNMRNKNIPLNETKRDKWELSCDEILKNDKEYSQLNKEEEDIIKKIDETGKKKDWREQGLLMEMKWKKIEELNKRYDELKNELKNEN